ncbi:ankyrin repeat-containing domain protein [Jackrogersella minutella]|nr:ankyrin repeat-containing domain protein [Jackrogersella minutella]
MLSAATYLGNTPLVRRLLQEGYCPVSYNYLFPPAMFLAAFAGNAELLKLFQEHLPEGWTKYMNGHQGLTLAGITGALERGDMNMVRLAAFPPSGDPPDDGSLESDGDIPWKGCTRSVDAYRDVCELAKPWMTTPIINIAITHQAQYGNLDMVRELLDRGAADKTLIRMSLAAATSLCHEETVDLFLDRGADPNDYLQSSSRGTAVNIAVRSGSLVIVRKLLGRGADISLKYDRSLHKAVLCEHAAILELLLESPSDQKQISNARETASREGLGSMDEV